MRIVTTIRVLFKADIHGRFPQLNNYANEGFAVYYYNAFEPDRITSYRPGIDEPIANPHLIVVGYYNSSKRIENESDFIHGLAVGEKPNDISSLRLEYDDGEE